MDTISWHSTQKIYLIYGIFWDKISDKIFTDFVGVNDLSWIFNEVISENSLLISREVSSLNKISGEIEELLVSLGIRDYFESVIAFEDVDHPKPQPDIYLENANNLFVDTQDCLVFEDSISGITAAKRAGMKCVALTTTMDRMQLIDADLIIDNFTEIDVDKLDEI